MAKNKLEDWDETAANNTDMGGIDLQENVMRPPAVNNEMREHMAQVAKWLGDDTLASAATTDLGSVPGRYISITGTTTITSFGTIKAGTIKVLRFLGALTLTHNATSLILPGGANITTAAGDTAIFVSEGSGNWRCVNYTVAAAGYKHFTNVVQQIFTASGTYTPTTGMVRCIIEAIGGGGGGGGCTGVVGSVAIGGGGGSGAYSRKFATAAQIGASQAVTIGAGGAGGSAGNNNGSPGGTTSVGSLLTAPGGNGGGYSSAGTITGVPGVGASTGTGDFTAAGANGGPGLSGNGTTYLQVGYGANSIYGRGGFSGNNANGSDGALHGAGGGGGGQQNAATARAGGNGAPGLVIITEFLA